MSSHSSASKELRAQAARVPEFHDIMSTLARILDESRSGKVDRNSVLLTCGLLEHALGEAIASKLILDTSGLKSKIFDGDHEREGVLGTVYTRNLIAHAMNIYGENTYNDINKIRITRNLFAHARNESDFSEEKLRTLCDFHVPKVKFSVVGLDHQKYISSSMNAIAWFMSDTIPYLLLHTSNEWVESINQRQWRESTFT